MQEEIESLQKEVSELKSRLTGKIPLPANKSILGWTPQLRKTGGKAQYWYCGKRVNGKLLWVFVGKDLAHAEAKIKAFCEVRRLAL
jgi:hypothetical protein